MRAALPSAPPDSAKPTTTDLPGAVLACLLVLAVLASALTFSFDLRRVPEAQMINVFYWFQREHEPVPLAIHMTFIVALMVALVRGHRAAPRDRATDMLDGGEDITARQVWLLAVAVTGVTWAITHWVMHDYALSGDEWSASFQANIFARGMLAAPVPESWRPYAKAMLPPYVRYDAAHGTWESMYLPVHAAIRSLFVRAGAESLANPALAGLTVVGLAGVARRLWPGQGRIQWLALGALVSSAQFLFMSGTAYAMPAHLCLNTWWLWCWLRREESAWYVAALPVIGVAALGLHQVFPHALFVAPFLIHLLLERKWTRTIGVGSTYLLGCVAWLGWMRRVGAGEGISLGTIFGVPNLGLDVLNAGLSITWFGPLVALMVVSAVPALRRDQHGFWLLLIGLVLTTALYAFFQFDQQHGWGYRYIYAVLPNMILLSALGAAATVRRLRRADARRLVRAAGAAAFCLVLVRAVQAANMVAPFAAASRSIREQSADVVLVPASSVWYGGDFVRNAPVLGGTPVVLNGAFPFGRAGVPSLPSGVKVVALTASDLASAGLPVRQMSLAVPQLPR